MDNLHTFPAPASAAPDPIVPGPGMPQLKHYPPNVIDAAFGRIQQNADACMFGLHRGADRNRVATNYMGVKTTYDQLDGQVEQVFRAMYAYGVRPGDCVTIALPNTPETLMYIYGTWRLGAIANPVDPRTNGKGIADRVRNTNSKLLVVILDLCDPKIDEIMDELPPIPVVVVSPADSFKPSAGLIPLAGGLLYKKKKKVFAANRPSLFGSIQREGKYYRLYAPDGQVRSAPTAIGSKPLPLRGSDKAFYIWHTDFCQLEQAQVDVRCVYYNDMPAAILYTSGTSSDGVIKGAVHSHASLNAGPGNFQYCVREEDYGPGKTFAGFAPFFSAYGMFCGMHASLCGGLEVLLIPVFDTNKFTELILKYKPNIFLAVPGFIEQFTRYPKLKGKSKKLSFINIPISGGDKMSGASMRAVNRTLRDNGFDGGLRIGYGSTELGGSICVMPHYDPETTDFNWEEDGNVGYLLPGCKAIVIDPETDEILPYGEEGEILLHSKSMMLYYHGNEAATDEITWYDKDGVKYYRMGDKGRLDENGTVYFVDRYKRSIMRPDGHTVHPSPIENVIMNHEAVQACAVVGLRWEGHSGAIPTAFIILKENYRTGDITAQLKDIDRFCKRLLPERDKAIAYKAVDELPFTLMGKIHFRELEKVLFAASEYVITDGQFFPKSA
ncbi:MAG: acyl--CoA ligase [Oscillospiraceae bacterium]|nr:acyl--CoA ligase [Oscillospiraceae bacterium]